MVIATDADPSTVLDLASEAAVRLSEECDGTMDEDTITGEVCVSEYEPAEGEAPPRAFGVNIEVSDERITDLICSGFEGGSGYWCRIERYENPDDESVEFKHNELPITARGAVICRSQLEDEAPELRLDRAAVERGLRLLPEKCPAAWADFIAENEDATTGDCFIQLCLLGDVVYG
jgi:hypothetical protein